MNIFGLDIFSRGLPIAGGGTGASSVEEARSNLGVYSTDEVDALMEEVSFSRAIWAYQDFSAGAITGTSVTLTANENGDSAPFSVGSILSGRAHICLASDNEEYAYSGTSKFFSTKIKINSMSGASITLNAAPHISWGTIRIWYQISASAYPENYIMPPLAVSSSMLDKLDPILLTHDEIGSVVQAYNSYLTGIDQALSQASSPTFAGLNITGKTGGVIPYFSSGILTTNSNFIFSSGVFRIGPSIGVTNGMSYGDTLSNVEVGIGQGSSNYLQTIWNYNATASSAYAEIKTKSGNNDIKFMKDGGKAIFANTALAIYGTANTYYTQLKLNEAPTANRTLNLVLGDADRTITLSGNPTLADWFDQAVKTTSSPTFAQLTVDNLNLNGNTLSTTDSGGNLSLDTNGGSIVLLDNTVCGAAGTALSSGFTTSRSSNPRIWLFETGAGTDAKRWEFLANSGTFRFRTSNDDSTNSVSIFNVTRSGVSPSDIAIPTATVTISSQLNIDNLRLDGNTISSTNSNGAIVFDPNGTGQLQFGTANNDYMQVRMGGGNQYGYVFGSFPGTGDGICIGYNFYYNSSGTGQVGNSGGGTAYIQVGYGDIQFFATASGGGNPTQKAYMADNGNWLYKGSATYEDNKYIYWGTGQDSCIGFDGSDTIWNLQNAGTGKLFWQVNDTRTNGALELVQYGTGDAAMMFTIVGVFSYSIGVDNSDSDKFKICASSAIGTNDAITIDSSSLVTVANLAISQTPSSAAAIASTHKLPISLNGSTYYILLTNV